MAQIKVLLVTIGPDEADDFVRSLVRQRLVACGNILAARSHYRWQGEVCHEQEAVVLMETAADRLDLAIAGIHREHPYDVPKIVVLDPERVNDDYAAWAVAETRPPAD